MSDHTSYQTKRCLYEIHSLCMRDYEVDMGDDNMSVIHVKFPGPENSLYHGGVWKIRAELPEDYPFKPPLIKFVNKIYHPNVDENSGLVCLDVISSNWKASSDLKDVIIEFLPGLLLCPNPDDPFNIEAGFLMRNDLPAFERKVKEHCERFAKLEDAGYKPEKEESSDEELSEDDE